MQIHVYAINELCIVLRISSCPTATEIAFHVHPYARRILDTTGLAQDTPDNTFPGKVFCRVWHFCGMCLRSSFNELHVLLIKDMTRLVIGINRL